MEATIDKTNETLGLATLAGEKSTALDLRDDAADTCPCGFCGHAPCGCGG